MRELQWLEAVLPLICFMIILPQSFVLFTAYHRFKQRKYLAVLAVIFSAALFLLLESLFILYGPVKHNRYAALQLARWQELSVLLLLPALPFFLGSVLKMSEAYKLFNRIMQWVSLSLFVLLFFTALLKPDWYISVKIPQVVPKNAIDWGRGQLGFLFSVRDIILGVYLFYSLFTMTLHIQIKKSEGLDNLVFIGFLLAGFFSIQELIKDFSDSYLFFLPNLHVQRFDIGLTLFTTFTFWGVMRSFIRQAQATDQLRKELEESQKLLQFQANYDVITDVYNRRAFFADLKEQLNRVKETGDFGAILLDLEGFHDLNEAYGSHIGDNILISVARRLQDAAQDGDRIYRIGSDEFGIITSSLISRDFLSRFSEIVQSQLTKPIELEGNSYYTSASLGVLFLPHDGETFDEATKNLFSCLKIAKKRKNAIQHFDQKIREIHNRQSKIILKIREGLKNNEFSVHYQPIVDQKNKVIAAEALVRWLPTEYTPDEFIPLAEISGLIYALSNTILNQTIHGLAQFVEEITFPVHINLSSAQFIDINYTKSLISRLNASGLTGKQISFELTESFLIQRMDEVFDSLLYLKEHGYKIFLDDFGTGYSSLQYLQDLPVDEIKIDKSFIQQIGMKKNSDKIIRTIIDLSQEFELGIIAEGVETEKQFKLLKKWGVEKFQGYLFHKPVPIDRLTKLK